MTLSVQNDISIAEIVVYAPLLAGGILLSARHGFGRNAGWLYLILFSLIRIVGSALELATISDPTNIGLYIGAVTLQNVGLSPLLLLLLGLLGRVLASVRQNAGSSPVDPRHLRLVQLVILVGLILGIVGGSQASSSYTQSGTIEPNTLSRVGLGLMIAGFVLLSLATALIALQASHAAAGERRIVAAVAVSLPFVLVRLVYSCVGTLANNRDFKPVIGNPYIQLGMSVVEEMIVVVICEGVGVTLRKIPQGAPAVEGRDEYAMEAGAASKYSRRGNYGRHAPQTEGRM